MRGVGRGNKGAGVMVERESEGNKRVDKVSAFSEYFSDIIGANYSLWSQVRKLFRFMYRVRATSFNHARNMTPYFSC